MWVATAVAFAVLGAPPEPLPDASKRDGKRETIKLDRKSEREQVDVEDVVLTGHGQFMVVLKTQQLPVRLLPIFVGEAEALAIRLRLDRRNPPRPLTLNLLEQVLAQGRIRVTEIAIDDMRGDVFLGRIALRQNGRLWHLDARPSDAIGLALGQNAPIFVSRRVLVNAAFDAEELRRGRPGSLEDDEGEESSGAAGSAGKTPEGGSSPEQRTNYEETL